MRRSTRKAYHKKVDSVLKREKQIKGIRIADSYLKFNSRDFWKEIELLRDRKRGPSAAVEGLTNGDEIANDFPDITRTYTTLLILITLRYVSYILMLMIELIVVHIVTIVMPIAITVLIIPLKN